MAIDQGTQTIAVSSQERIWRVNIETARSADPVVTVFREVVKLAADGSLISQEPAHSASRNLSDVAGQTITVPGTSPGVVLMIQQLADTIAAVADQWRQQDIAAGK